MGGTRLVRGRWTGNKQSINGGLKEHYVVEYDNATDEWVALFDEDGEQTKIKFPDEDVRML